MNTIPIKYVYDINTKQGVDLINVEHALCNGTREIQLHLTERGADFTLDRDSTVTASFVTADKRKILLADDVACTVTEDGDILVPIDSAVLSPVAGNIDVEIQIVSQNRTLALPYPLWIRIRGSIVENAHIAEVSKGTVAEQMKAVSEALENKADKATTLEEYGITDGATKKYVIERIQANALKAGTNITIENGVISATGGEYVLTEQDKQEIAQMTSAQIPTKVSQLENDKGFLTEHQDISGKANFSDIPKKTSQLENDNGYYRSGDDMNAWDLLVIGNAEFRGDVAVPDPINETDAVHKKYVDDGLATKADASDIPTKISQMTNDSGFLTEHTLFDQDITYDDFFNDTSLWSLGQIDATTGKDTNYTSDNHIKMLNYFTAEYDGTVVKNLTSNLTVYVYEYDESKIYCGTRTSISPARSIQLTKGHKYKFILTGQRFSVDDFIATNCLTISALSRNTYFYGNNVTKFRLANPAVYEYMTTVEYDSNDYSTSKIFSTNTQPYRADRPLPVVVKVPFDTEAVTTYVLYSDESSLVNSNRTAFYQKIEVPYGVQRAQIFNLIPGKTYYYKICYLYADGTEKITDYRSFTTDNSCITRMLHIDGINNARDLGGYSCSGGKVAYGKLFRSSAFDEAGYSEYKITDKGIRELIANVGVRAELDLRSASQAVDLGDGMDFKGVPFESYFNSINATKYGASWKTAFEFIVNEIASDKPVIFHCQGGADRTGTLTAVLQGVLGVSESDINKEYELTSGFAERKRNSTSFKWSEMMNALKSYGNGTLQNNCIQFLLDCGISQDSIDSFRKNMVVD